MKLKRMFLAAVLAIASVAAANADTYSRDESVLPAAARETVRNNFKAGISVIKIDKELGRVSDYEVVLTDGTEVKFDRSGNWKDIEVAPGKQVPAKFIPDGVSTFVKQNHKGARIVGIEKERSGYEVQLSNDVDLKFDKNGNFLKYD